MFLTELHHSFLEACSSWQLLKLLGCLGAVLRSHRFPACASKLGRKVWISSVMPHTSCQALVRPQSTRQRVSDVHRALWLFVPVVPGQARGGSFQKEKNYIAQKEFAYRMCARRPTSAMPKSFLCCERAFCRSMLVMSCALK